MTSFRIPTNIFHITAIENLDSILNCGFLFCKNSMEEMSLHPQNIAHQGIQDRRTSVNITVGEGGNLHDYVPFSFAPRSPMLNTIKRGNVNGYANGQENICTLVSDVQKIVDSGVNYIFTNGHAIMQPVEFFNSVEDLNQVDWEIFYEDPLIPRKNGYAKYWDNRHDASKPKWLDRSRRRQAEFLVHRQLEWQFINEVSVINDEKEDIVKKIFENYNIQTTVSVKPEYYFLDNQ